MRYYTMDDSISPALLNQCRQQALFDIGILSALNESNLTIGAVLTANSVNEQAVRYVNEMVKN